MKKFRKLLVFVAIGLASGAAYSAIAGKTCWECEDMKPCKQVLCECGKYVCPL